MADKDDTKDGLAPVISRGDAGERRPCCEKNRFHRACSPGRDAVVPRVGTANIRFPVKGQTSQ